MSDETAIKPRKPARSHKSKKEKAKKPTTRVIGNFIERVKKPAVMGQQFTSRMVRIDAEFADWMRAEAKRNGVSVTEVSRSVYQSLTD